MLTFSTILPPPINFERIEGDIIKLLVRKTTLGMEGRSKLSMSGKKTGRTYKRKKKIHQASAPGEAPAVVTGFLRNSIQSTFQHGGLIGTVTFGAEYAVYLADTRDVGNTAFQSAAADFHAGMQRIIQQL